MSVFIYFVSKTCIFDTFGRPEDYIANKVSAARCIGTVNIIVKESSPPSCTMQHSK